MLRKLRVQNFRSLADVTIELPQLSVLFGSNAAGKSNILEAIQALSWIGNARTLADGLSSLRGYPFEAFFFGEDGWPGLFHQGSAQFTLQADVSTNGGNYRYRVQPEMDFTSGELRVTDEFLTQLTKSGSVSKNSRAAIERVQSNLHVRRKGKPSYPRQEPIGLNHSVLSDRSLAGDGYPWLEQVRTELWNWRTYYLEPRTAMRVPQSPADVFDIGRHGEYIAPFLYKLRAQYSAYFDAVYRALRSTIPSIEVLQVQLDERHGTLDLWIQQAGVAYSARVISEGTLRVLALCTLVVNPWGGSLVALEEPENGVHPRRLELIARMLTSLALDQGRQVVVTTHSPLLCDAILTEARSRKSDDIALFNVRRAGQQTVVQRFDMDAPLLQDMELAAAFTNPAEDGMFENLVMRGLIDE
ncbi:AAA family ATPase [Candidatus Palauibacter sp.]|uniref:AAA family ATPase n=1 Tax=Candidatus Palauibacter sp. TaxID=3101350 RepID=UPI003B02B3F2